VSTEDTHLTREIIDAIRGGDRGAFDTLFTRVGGKAYVYIFNRMGNRLRRIMEPEDVLQEVYRQAYEAFSSFVDAGSGSMDRWLVTIARNQIRRIHKHHFGVQKRDPEREVPLEAPRGSAGSAFDPSSPEQSPSRIVAGDEEVQRVARAVQSLEPDARELVLQHVYEGRPIEHIATDLGIPRTTLNHRLALALEQLRVALS
jgi:RNA polymerase sigma-70 factor (ECF subfamily)